MLDIGRHPHGRYNPLNGEWVLVSPQRTRRPWQGQLERAVEQERLSYDADCYLCPGNARAGGQRNPVYEQVTVFTNDFAALLPDSPAAQHSAGSLLRVRGERGTCRVVCFSPRHDKCLSELELPAVEQVVEAWVEEYLALGAEAHCNHVQIFENRGAMMGASNPHPHGQIWATEHVPLFVAREQERQLEHYLNRGSTLLADYLSIELENEERLVCANDHFVVVVPFWAVWPFETLVISRRPVGSLGQLDSAERAGLADILIRLTTRYDNLFETPFPYSMGFHQAPTDGRAHPEWHLHQHFYPPLLRSAQVRKFMVGFELLAEPQRDITPEQAAERLRSVSDQHYRFGAPRTGGGAHMAGRCG